MMGLPEILERRIEHDSDWARLVRSGGPPTEEQYRLTAGYEELPAE
jgi:hypothetical protein